MLSVALLAPLVRVPRRTALRALAWVLAFVLGVAVSVLPANAAAANTAANASTSPDAASALEPALIEQVKGLALARPAEAAAARIEVVVGQLDPRLHLAPCERVEPYVPLNTRLWGKSRIGLRCARGPVAWNVYLPVTVKAWGRALVLPAGAVAGSTVAEADLAEAEVDIAEEPSPVVADMRQVAGRVLAQSVRPGQALRQSHVKARQWFAAGDTVKIVAMGEGFSLEGSGQAISNGVEGQTARVRTESGNVVSGTPSGERRMDFTP